MPLPIVAATYQAVLVWNNPSAPRAAANVLHFRNSLGVNTAADLYADMDTNVTTSMWSVLSTASRVVEVNITKLDGSSAGQAFQPAAVAKWAGANAGDLILQGAAVVSLKSNVRGPRGRNRVFLPWVVESVQSNGVLASGNVTAMGNAWGAFVVAMSAAGWDLVAVSGVHADANLVTTIAVRSALKTQRRRAL